MIPFLTTEIKQTSTFCLNSLTELLLKPKLYPIIVLVDPHSSTDSTWPHSYFPGLEIQYNKLKYRSKSQILNCKLKKSSLYPESSKRLTKYRAFVMELVSFVLFCFQLTKTKSTLYIRWYDLKHLIQRHLCRLSLLNIYLWSWDRAPCWAPC